MDVDNTSLFALLADRYSAYLQLCAPAAGLCELDLKICLDIYTSESHRSHEYIQSRVVGSSALNNFQQWCKAAVATAAVPANIVPYHSPENNTYVAQELQSHPQCICHPVSHAKRSRTDLDSDSSSNASEVSSMQLWA